MRRLGKTLVMGCLVAALAMPVLHGFIEGGRTDVVLAQDEGEVVGGGQSYFDMVWQGGIPEAIIILMSIVGLALIIEHFVSITREKLMPPYLLNELENLFDEEEYEEAMDLCDGEQNFLCRVVGAGLSKIGSGYEPMLMAVQSASEEEATTLHQKISYLSLIATTAPMMGLLGTVAGMMVAFNKIAMSGGAANAADLAGGITMALVTTLTGLIVAIPVMMCYMIFRNRVIKVVQEVESITNDLMDRFRPTE